MKSSLRFFCFVISLFASPHPGWTADHPSLVKEWEISFGPVSEGHAFYRGAVCRDGTFYLSDGLGRVVQVSTLGVVVADAHFDALQDALAITCDDQSNLVAAPPQQLVTVGLDANGVLAVLRTVPVSPDIGREMALARSGPDAFLVLAVKGVGVHAHRVDSQGHVLASYNAATGASSRALATAASGTFARNPLSQQVLYIPENPYVFMKYDSLLGLVGFTPRQDPEFQSPAPDGRAGAVSAPGDRVMRAAYLPDGDVLVQVVKRSVGFSSRAQANVVRSSSYLELFDNSLNLKATGISIAGLGQMQGAAGDGSLYFSRIWQQGGIHIAKARLAGN